MIRQMPPSYLSNFDSASGFLRATALCLKGKDFPGWGLTSAIKPLVRSAGMLPRRAREGLYAGGGLNEAISPAHTDRVNAEKLAAWATGLYPNDRYPGVMIGSSSGALTHLAAILRMPWLPQTLFIPVRQVDVHPDDATEGMQAGTEPGRRLLDANPDLQLHHMHDPNQDRLMLQFMTYFRVKWRRLPDAYRAFLRQRLAPGDPIVIVDCRRRWPVTRLGDRHFFQFGALGGATEDEFLHGGPRVEAYLKAYGSHRTRWDPPAADEHAPEAEWGFEPELGEDIERFAAEHGYRVMRIVFDEPEDLSPLVADFYRHLYRRRGLRSNRLMVESFLLLDPLQALRTGSVPYWMKFNMEPSHEALERYLGSVDRFDEIRMSLFQHGVDCVGLVGPDKWRTLLEAHSTRSGFLGLDESLHPRDFGALARYQSAMQAMPSSYPLPGPSTIGEFGRFADQSRHRDTVRCEGPA